MAVRPGFDPVAAARRYSPTQVQLELLRKDFRRFMFECWPIIDPAPLVWTWSLEAMCEHLAWVTAGDIRFLMINVPPRSSKSTTCTVGWPAWEWAQNPKLQYLTGSYSLQLAGRDTLKSRRLIESKWYQERFGHVFTLTEDENQKRQYSNDKGGRRVTTATDAATTGEGGNRIILDDPHNARDVESALQRQSVIDWWDNALSSRLNQANIDSWMIIGQRTHADDLFGHILQNEDMNEIVHLCLPNEYNPKRRCVTVNPKTGATFEDPREEEGELLNPQRLDAATSARLKRKMGARYELQYNQDTEAGGGQILAKERWRKWEHEQPPECQYIIDVYDTALGDKQQNDYSARTSWGVFRFQENLNRNDVTFRAPERTHIILIGAWRARVPFYKLRQEAIRRYREARPDYTLIEKKVSGISLIQEFRKAGVRVTPISIDHGGGTKIDIVHRANLASPVLNDGLVWYMPRKWADDVIDECARIPGAANDDYATTVCMAMMWLRRRYEIGLWEDEKDDGEVRLFKRSNRVYG